MNLYPTIERANKIYKAITMKGFVASSFVHQMPEFHRDMSGWIQSGQLKYHETITDGIENAPMRRNSQKFPQD